MNILHHKSWHVRNKDNIQRVRRDEEKAAAEEKEKQRRIALAEQEARTEFLRKKARGSLPSSTETLSSIKSGTDESYGPQPASSSTAVDSMYGTGDLASDLQSGSRGFINFFKAEEEGDSSKSVKRNIDHEAERKAEKEEWEKKVGILTYLGQSATEVTGVKPWYEKGKRKPDTEIEVKLNEAKHRKLQNSLDPMNQMTKYLDMKSSSKSSSREKEKHKHKKKHKHKEKEKESTKTKPSKTIEELRAERLRREAEERRKVADLMARARGEKPKESGTSEPVSDRDRKYNSMYNPDFARKPKQR